MLNHQQEQFHECDFSISASRNAFSTGLSVERNISAQSSSKQVRVIFGKKSTPSHKDSISIEATEEDDKKH